MGSSGSNRSKLATLRLLLLANDIYYANYITDPFKQSMLVYIWQIYMGKGKNMKKMQSEQRLIESLLKF